MPTGPPLDDATWQALARAAEEAAARAHAPYSRFSVGAAVLTAAGDVFAGCNVENASYGLTVCAERAAVFAAVCGSPQPPAIVAVYITSTPPDPAPPCGACRQVLAEFGDPVVSFQDQDGRRMLPLARLFPEPFRR